FVRQTIVFGCCFLIDVGQVCFGRSFVFGNFFIFPFPVFAFRSSVFIGGKIRAAGLGFRFCRSVKIRCLFFVRQTVVFGCCFLIGVGQVCFGRSFVFGNFFIFPFFVEICIGRDILCFVGVLLCRNFFINPSVVRICGNIFIAPFFGVE